MSRLPLLTESDLSDEQRAAWDNIATGPRAKPGRPGGGRRAGEGRLIGPFNVMLHAPAIGDPVQNLCGTLRFGTSLPRNLLELAILTVGAEWRAQFEFWAHARMAREAGIAGEVVAAIRDGQEPSLEGDEVAVYAFCRELLDSKRVSDQRYASVVDIVGRQGAVELVSLLGYYTLVSMLLDTFQVPLPPGTEAPFAE